MKNDNGVRPKREETRIEKAIGMSQRKRNAIEVTMDNKNEQRGECPLSVRRGGFRLS